MLRTAFRKSFLTITSVAAAAAALPSQTLVRDIHTAPRELSSSPQNSLVVGTTMYFAATHESLGPALFKTDGTANGTVLVKAFPSGSVLPAELTPSPAGGIVFTADDGTNGIEIWKSNGTSNGTVLLRDIHPSGSSKPSELTYVVNKKGGNSLWFAADDGTNGVELWTSDGTTAGTKLADDLNPNGSSSPANLVSTESGVAFSADDGTHGREMWTRKPANPAAAMVADIRKGAESGVSSSPLARPVFLVNMIYFPANDGSTGEELWKSTGVGASQVVDLQSGSSSSSPTRLTLFGSEVCFAANDGRLGLFKTDGTSAGTSRIRRFNSNHAQVTAMQAFGARLFYAAEDDFRTGVEPYVTDGTANGTILLANINTRTSILVDSLPKDFTVLGANVVFSATSSTKSGNKDSDRELWITDGTATGTSRIADFRAGGNGVSRILGVLGSKLYFAGETIIDKVATGVELCETDGTESGTKMTKNLGLSTQSTEDSSPVQIVRCDGRVFFQASSREHGAELWVTDGTTTGTQLVKDIRAGDDGSSPNNLICRDDVVLFAANDGTNGTELWKSDGSAAGTVMVKDIKTGSDGSNPYAFVEFRDELYFFANKAPNRVELWRTDGTTAGTSQVKGITGPFNDAKLPVVVGNTLFFAVGYDLYKSDGTSAGTASITRIASLRDIAAFGGKVYVGSDSSLHVHDPVSGSTTTLKQFSYPSAVQSMTAIGSTLYFTAASASEFIELWKTDGTESGTVLVKDIAPGTKHSQPRNLTAVGSTLFFSANDDTNGTELWKSDGTESGTVLVKDIRSGSESSSPSSFSVLGDTVYFAADDGTNGSELWKSDGTTHGTVLVADLHSAGSAAPGPLVQGRGFVFFSARSLASGRELFQMRSFTVETFGRGCAGTADLAPRIGYAGTPQLGKVFQVRVADARAQSVAVLLFGTGRTRLRIPPSGACSFYLTTPILLQPIATDATGAAAFPLPIPSDTRIVGAAPMFQWFTLDPQGPIDGRLAASDGMQIVVGQ